MGGIAGAVGFLDERIERAVQRMTTSLAHRGRDGAGIWRSGSRSHGALLVATRNAVLDPSPRADQPMLDRQSGDALVYDGATFNFAELRTELAANGAAFASTGDAEVVLRGLAAHGAAFVQRMEGMFALASWSAGRQSLLLARDRLGFKPLYLAEIPGDAAGSTFLFASEVRALLDTGLIPRALDPEGLSTYLWNGFTIAPKTLVRGVESLLPGTWIELGADGRRSAAHRYWELGAPEGRPDGRARMAKALPEAVERQLVSDVPVGFFLSGGIDSSAVVALATRAAKGRLSTFNIAFEFEELDESPYARAVASSLGSDHHEILITQQTFQDSLDLALASFDQPSLDGINTFFVSRAVREAGIRVALGGTGGDDLFGGNRTFVDIPRAAAWGRRLAPVPRPLVRLSAELVRRIKAGPTRTLPHQTRWGKLGDVLGARGNILQLYQLGAAQFTPAFLPRLSPTAARSSSSFGIPGTRFGELEERAARNATLFAIAQLELSLFVGERLLRDIDSVSSAVGLEVRSPLLDDALIEAWRSAEPEAALLPLGKKQVLLDAALSNLDPALFERPKAGFVMPFDRWFRDRLRRTIDESFADPAHCRAAGLEPGSVQRVWQAFQRADSGIYWTRIWALHALLSWCRRTGVAVDE